MRHRPRHCYSAGRAPLAPPSGPSLAEHVLLLSMFFFYVEGSARTRSARCTFAAMMFCSFLCFTHGPAITLLHRFVPRLAQLARSLLTPPGVDRAPPRGVTVFAERLEQTGASKPQKQRRHFTPTQSPVGLLIEAARSTTHAPSRRLQRVSVSCARVPRGQPPRRRPTEARLRARCASRMTTSETNRARTLSQR